MRLFLKLVTRDVVSAAGVSVTTAAAVIFLVLFLAEVFGMEAGAYLGIITYLVLPTFFVAGLLLIPLGLLRARRRRRTQPHGEEDDLPVIDLNERRTQTVVLSVAGLTLINTVILSIATYQGVHFMDSTAFCGTTCHSVMQPEYTAYQHSPHARVACVACHIGPGADWFARSKLSGAWQVVATAFDLYPRPIPTPIEELRPARETCEQCHWPSKFVGDRLLVRVHYAPDAANTELKSVVLLKVGGVHGRSSQGIHWHVDPNIRIRYRADPTRETIFDVEMTRADGETVTFTVDDPEGSSERVWRSMDCIDCHNRPTHIYRSAEAAVEHAIAAGEISSDLPFVRREGVSIIQRPYGSHEEAQNVIPAALLAFYRQHHPPAAEQRAEDIERAGQALVAAFTRNVFPRMNVTWGTYPNHIGHQESDGCFRCHDDEHESSEGEVISQDCDLCHTLLAEEEKDPTILDELNP